jgi:DNA-binding NtrC family response regulator
VSAQIRVLLADDEGIFVRSLAKVLAKKGIQAQTVSDGRLALDALDQAEFDVIVLDLAMPNMDGLATLEAIRQRDITAPVVLRTGSIDMDRVTQALKGGASEVLFKPCPVDDLVSAIENAYERKMAAQGVPLR